MIGILTFGGFREEPGRREKTVGVPTYMPWREGELSKELWRQVGSNPGRWRLSAKQKIRQDS